MLEYKEAEEYTINGHSRSYGVENDSLRSQLDYYLKDYAPVLDKFRNDPLSKKAKSAKRILDSEPLTDKKRVQLEEIVEEFKLRKALSKASENYREEVKGLYKDARELVDNSIMNRCKADYHDRYEKLLYLLDHHAILDRLLLFGLKEICENIVLNNGYIEKKNQLLEKIRKLSESFSTSISRDIPSIN